MMLLQFHFSTYFFLVQVFSIISFAIFLAANIFLILSNRKPLVKEAVGRHHLFFWIAIYINIGVFTLDLIFRFTMLGYRILYTAAPFLLYTTTAIFYICMTHLPFIVMFSLFIKIGGRNKSNNGWMLRLSGIIGLTLHLIIATLTFIQFLLSYIDHDLSLLFSALNTPIFYTLLVMGIIPYVFLLLFGIKLNNRLFLISSVLFLVYIVFYVGSSLFLYIAVISW